MLRPLVGAALNRPACGLQHPVDLPARFLFRREGCGHGLPRSCVRHGRGESVVFLHVQYTAKECVPQTTAEQIHGGPRYRDGVTNMISKGGNDVRLKRHTVVLGAILSLALLVTGCLPTGSALGEGGQPAPSEAIELDGTRWDVVELGGEPVTGDAQGTLDFSGGQVSGVGFCNGFGGVYELDGTELTFGELAQTLMACLEPEGVMELESAYMAALNSATAYRLDGDNLVLTDAEGTDLVVLSPAETVSLEGTSWQLTGYSDGLGVTSLVLGSEITAIFDGENVGGSAGCNSYTASYTLDGDEISVGPAASTRMACMEPEGVMEQESAYLEALSAAATYELGRDRLTLYDGEGQTLVMFTAGAE